MEYKSTRELDQFFDTVPDMVIRNRHKKQLFLAVGGVRQGKTTNITVRVPYLLSHKVKPIVQNGRQVRESLWFAVRSSENAAVETFMEAITDSIFSPEIISMKNSPVKVHGSHPRFITIEHDLADGTLLRMTLECHGFNTPNAEERLRSRSALGAMIPELQGVPKKVVKTLMERVGTWRPQQCKLEYNLDGKDIIISGASELKMVFADINIEPRPHYTYEMFFDDPDIDKSEYMIIKVPEVITPSPVEDIDPSKVKELKDLYPSTIFKKKDTLWLPNPDAYMMTKHWEREDEDGEKIPWTGYEQWFSKVRTSTESEINRLVLGRPDSIGGEASVYPNFDKIFHVEEKGYLVGVDIYIGYDPGKSSGFTFFQIVGEKEIHIFDELYFSSNDGIRTRGQIENFLMPRLEGEYPSSRIIMALDPAGKNDSSLGESPLEILRENGLGVENLDNRFNKISNQDIQTRKSNLEHFIDTHTITISPKCVFIIKSLSGGFCYTTNKAGIISNSVDKYNPYSHIAESAQYAAIILYRKLIKINKPVKKARFVKLRAR